MAKLTDTIIHGDLVVTGTTRFKNDITIDEQLKSNIIPDADSTYSLGSAINRFSYVYADNIDLSANIATAGNIEAGGYLSTNGELRTEADQLIVRNDVGVWVTIAAQGINMGDFTNTNGTVSYGMIGVGAYDFRIIKDDNSDIFFLDNNAVFSIGASALTYNGNTVWHTGNDGAASGLDADTLDGQEGSYYLALSNATGSTSDISEGTNLYYTDTRANAAIDARVDKTFVDALNVDADLLDGQHGSYYLAASAYTAADVLSKLLTVDGAASGLDADTLDGQDSTAFAKTVAVTPAKTANFNASVGEIYLIDTTSAAIIATLPATPPDGSIVKFVDTKWTFGTNALTVARNGSSINGDANDFIVDINGIEVVLTYVGSSYGWVVTASTPIDGNLNITGNLTVNSFESISKEQVVNSFSRARRMYYASIG